MSCIVDNSDCAYGDLRLVAGTSSLEGRLEVCIGGRWGTVCDDDWDESDAGVACSQLGFSRGGAVAHLNAFFGQGSGPIFFDQTECIGNESKLIDCTSSGVAVHNCGHNEDAAISCQRKANKSFCSNILYVASFLCTLFGDPVHGYIYTSGVSGVLLLY